MSLIADFKARFPEFSESVVDQYIPILEPVRSCYFVGSYTNCNREIVLNLLAHLMVIETNAGTGGLKSTNSRSVGSVSESFSSRTTTGGNSDFFTTTKYGQRFMMLTKFRAGSKFV